MRIHCLQHLEFETFGTIRKWIENRAHKLTITLPSEAPAFPDPDDFDLLIIMGGLMSVYEEEAYPWIKLEKEFVKIVIEADKPVLGSCFGGQLLAEVLGARVSKNRFEEIGWHRVEKVSLPAGPEVSLGANSEACVETGPLKGPEEDNDHSKNISENLPECFPEEFTAFMWHEDTFEIPAGAVKLFESEACPNQGYIYNGKVVGLQFHPEADGAWIGELVKNCGHELAGGKYVRTEAEILGQETYLREAEELTFGLLDWFEKIITN